MKGKKFTRIFRCLELKFKNKRAPFSSVSEKMQGNFVSKALWGVALVLAFFAVFSAVSVFADSGDFKPMSHGINVYLITTGNDWSTIETFTETFNFTITNTGDPVNPGNITHVNITVWNGTFAQYIVNSSTIFDPTDWSHTTINDSNGNILIIMWNTSTNPIIPNTNKSFWFDAQAPSVSANTTATWNINTMDDLNGTAAESKSTLVINDDIPPTSTITEPLNNTHWRNPIIVNGTASDPQSGVQYVEFCYAIVGNAYTCVTASGTTSWTYSWTPSANDIYNIDSRATDNLNNTEALGGALTITYDTVAPSFINSSAVPDHISPNASPGAGDNTSINATANDRLSGTLFYSFEVRNSASVLIKESGTVTGTNNTMVSWIWNGTDSNNNFVSEGYYNITISVWDLAGNNNTNHPTGGYNITVDNTYPIISNLQPSGTITDTTPILSLNTNEVTTCYYSNVSISNATNIFANTSSTFHDQQLELPYGTYTYYVKCLDSAQNDANASTTFTIQSPTPPIGETSGGGGGGFLPTGGKVFVNAPPSLETIPTLFAKVGKLFTYQVSADDPNDDPLTFSDDTILFNIGKENGIISFIPAESQIGSHKITITVSDGKLEASTSFILVIEPAEEETAPTVETLGPTGLFTFARASWIAALIIALVLGYITYRYYTKKKYGTSEPEEEVQPSEPSLLG